MEKFRAFRAIASAGLVAGILDITSAFVLAGLKGVGPIRVLQGVAMGLLGQQALEGGLATAGLGLAIHFSIAFAAASVFYTAKPPIHFPDAACCQLRHALWGGRLRFYVLDRRASRLR